MNCPVCNTEINENETICKNCGTPLTLKQRAFSTYRENNVTKPLKTLDFFLIFLLKLLPVINIIVYITWAVCATNLNRKSYARAKLLFAIIETIFVVIAGVLLYPYILPLI